MTCSNWCQMHCINNSEWLGRSLNPNVYSVIVLAREHNQTPEACWIYISRERCTQFSIAHARIWWVKCGIACPSLWVQIRSSLLCFILFTQFCMPKFKNRSFNVISMKCPLPDTVQTGFLKSNLTLTALMLRFTQALSRSIFNKVDKERFLQDHSSWGDSISMGD